MVRRMTGGGSILVGDIGGTHIRLAWVTPGGVRPFRVLQTSAFRSFEDALRHFLAQEKRETVSAAFFAVAGIVLDGHASMTNLDWEMDEAALTRALGAERVRIVNDFTAAALGLPHLKPNEMTQIGGGRPRPDAPKAVIGPGTGLGVGALVPDSHGGFVALSGEGGHVDLAPTNARELAVIGHLLAAPGHVSAERVLSGEGLTTLYRTLTAFDGVKAKSLSAPEIAEAARRHADAHAVESIALFTGWLGAVAGDLALTLGAHGGVYLAGGILPRWGALFDAKLFRRRFEAKGRMRAFLAPIPVYLVTAGDLALRGLAALARQASRRGSHLRGAGRRRPRSRPKRARSR